jgi:hypothetical protein
MIRSISAIFVFIFLFPSHAQEKSFTSALALQGFENVRSIEVDSDLYITYENNLFRFEAKGLAVIFNWLSGTYLNDIEFIHLLIRSQDIPMVVVSVHTTDLTAFRDGFINSQDFITKLSFSFNVDSFDSYFTASNATNSSYFKLDIPVGLELDYALGDFNDGLMTRFYLNPRVSSVLGRGIDFEFKFQNIIQNDLPGRAISYPSILRVSQNFRFNNGRFLNLSLGYLPQQRYGVHTRFRNYLVNERFYIELLFGVTRFGYLDQNLKPVSNRNSDAIWQTSFNYRWNKFDTDINFTYGVFYSGDLGYKLQLTRQFNEVYFNLFYARTDVLSAGSFGSTEEGIIGFSLSVPFGQSKFLKPRRLRVRTEDNFNLLYRYSGFSFSGIDIMESTSIFTDIREFYPEVLRKGLIRHLE